MSTFRPGMLVEVVAAYGSRRRFIGERFVLTARGPMTSHGPSWTVPPEWRKEVEFAEEIALKPVGDEGFDRFMERTLKPVDLGVKPLEVFS